MNILFLSNVFPDAAQPSRGTYNLQTCRALAKEHRVRVIAPRPWTEVLRGRLQGKRDSPGDADIEVSYPTYWYPPKILREHYGDFLWRSIQPEVRRLEQEFRPDAVLSYWAHPDGEAAVRLARRFGVPAAVITGGSDVLVLTNCPSRGERVRWVLQNADAVLTVSNGVQKRVIDLGVDEKRAHTVYQGVDETIFHPGSKAEARASLAATHTWAASDCQFLLWVGRMVGLKRLDVLIDGCADLKAQGVDFNVCLIGDGPERSVVTQQIDRLNLAGSVHMIGAITPELLGNWYRAADLTLLTSDSEGLPNTLRESVACGTPFVSTDVGSVRELADERLGLLIPTDDPKALSEGIVSMLAQITEYPPEPPEPRTWDDRATEIVEILNACRTDHPVTASRKKAMVTN